MPLIARAQQSGKIRRIGVLMSVAEGDPESPVRLSAFMQELREFGLQILELELELIRSGSAASPTRSILWN